MKPRAPTHALLTSSPRAETSSQSTHTTSFTTQSFCLLGTHGMPSPREPSPMHDYIEILTHFSFS